MREYSLNTFEAAHVIEWIAKAGIVPVIVSKAFNVFEPEMFVKRYECVDSDSGLIVTE
jgi:hypothetical protein